MGIVIRVSEGLLRGSRWARGAGPSFGDGCWRGGWVLELDRRVPVAGAPGWRTKVVAYAFISLSRAAARGSVSRGVSRVGV